LSQRFSQVSYHQHSHQFSHHYLPKGFQSTAPSRASQCKAKPTSILVQMIDSQFVRRNY
jgi:hypothetical protein